MQAIILAAGEGRRLGDPEGRPKCLQEVAGRPLLEHHLDALDVAGIEDVTVVVGHARDRVRDVAGNRVNYVVNRHFATTNSMCSFELAGHLVRDDVMVMNSDLYFHRNLLLGLAEAGGDALLYDSGSGSEAEQMKVCVRNHVLVEMSKVLHPDRVSGENVGVLRLTRATAQHVARAATRLLGRGQHRAWLATAVNQVAPDRAVRCLDVAGLPWIEIDFPEDLRRARTTTAEAVRTTTAQDVATTLGTAALRWAS